MTAKRARPQREPEPPKEPSRSPVRFNAVKHGIFSVSPVIPWLEREQDWLAFRDRIFENLQPEGGLELALADRVAALLWRLMRIIRYERETVSNDLSHVSSDVRLAAAYTGEELPKEITPAYKEKIDRQAMSRLLPDDRTLNKIMRYETRLHRHLLQTLHQFALLKGFRHSLPHNSKHGVANLDPAPLTRTAALPTGPSLSTDA